MPATLEPHSAAAYAFDYRAALTEAEALVKPLSHEQFNWKPTAEEWSVAECIVHLNKTGQAYIGPFGRALDRAVPGGKPPFRYGFFGWQFIKAVSPTSQRKLKTFTSITPDKSEYEADQVMAAFRELTASFIRICKRADGLDLTRTRMASPLLPLVRLQVGAYLEALANHEYRHIGQARRVTEHDGFPRA